MLLQALLGYHLSLLSMRSLNKRTTQFNAELATVHVTVTHRRN